MYLFLVLCLPYVYPREPDFLEIVAFDVFLSDGGNLESEIGQPGHWLGTASGFNSRLCNASPFFLFRDEFESALCSLKSFGKKCFSQRTEFSLGAGGGHFHIFGLRGCAALQGDFLLETMFAQGMFL